MKRSVLVGASLSAVILACQGCTSEKFDTSNDYDAVLTIKDKEYNYKKNKTYAVVDDLRDLSEFAETPIDIKEIDKWEEIILTRIHKNMKDLGYTEETGDIEAADVVVAAGVVAAENWQFYSYYPWWGWYGWYYYPYYGGATVGVNFSSGSVVLVMIDPERTITPYELTGDTAYIGDAGDEDGGVPENVYRAIWGAGIHGLLNYVTETKVKNGIDQAFEQSPYLNVGGGK